MVRAIQAAREASVSATVTAAREIVAALECQTPSCACHGSVRRGFGVTHCCGHTDVHQPSLSVSERDGRVLVHCHAGCAQEHLIEALRERDLWTTRDEPPAPPPIGRSLKVDAIYHYADPSGTVVYRVVRSSRADGHKTFEVWHPNGAGWLRTLGGAETVPYRLPQLAAADRSAWVLVAEGEKCADRLASAGMVATTSPFGAGKWPAAWGERYMAGRRVAVLRDNDEPGRKHGTAVADSCAGHAATVRVVDLPDLGEHGDVADWLEAGHGAAELLGIVERTPEHRRTALERADRPCTDMGNAERLVERHGADLRYVSSREQWYLWDGRRWRADDLRAVERLAKETHRTIYAEAEAAKESVRRKELAAHAARSEAAAKVAAALSLARSDERVALRAEQMDRDPWLLNVANGTIDLRTGELREHRREDLITMIAPVEYDAEAQLELWDRFLRDVTGGDLEVAAFLQRAVGYSLTGDTREERMFMPIGRAASGKTTLAEAIKAALGDYATMADAETFLRRRDSGGPRNDVARLDGRRMVVTIEMDEGRHMAEGLVKHLTGGDTVIARFLHQEHFEFRPTFKLWTFANVAPKVSDEDDGIWRRVSRLPLDHPVPPEQRDPAMKITLRDVTTAGPAILAWAVHGCLAWQREGLGSAPAVERVTAEYRSAMDPLAPFIEERCVLEEDAATAADGLYRAYAEWAKASGDSHPMTKTAFGRRLTSRGFAASRTHSGRQWSGLRLREQERLEYPI